MTKKIVFIGESNTAARPVNGINQGDTFSQKIGNALGYSTVINAGIGGNTTAMMLARFQSDVLAHAPDHITLSPGINDVGNAIAAGSASSGLSAYYNNINAMVAAAKAANIKITLMSPPLVRSTVYIENIPPYNDIIRQVCSENNVPFVDLYFEFLQLYFTVLNTSPVTFNNMYVDWQHISGQGHSFASNVVMKTANCKACRP